MLLHDASDVPLDLLRLATAFKWKLGQLIFFPITLIFWIYWRLWYLPVKVMNSVNSESVSFIFNLGCAPTFCTWTEYPLNCLLEKGSFLTLLGTLFILHIVWFWLLLKKGYRELVVSGKPQKKTE